MRCELIPPKSPVERNAKSVQEQVWLVQATSSHALGVALGDLCAATRRTPRAALARQVAMYLCHVVFRIGISQIARAFERDPSTVAHALARIEDMRDDGEFDRTIGLLETMLDRAWGDA
jgi:chromosomal replication initiation ATPase DnaA